VDLAVCSIQNLQYFVMDQIANSCILYGQIREAAPSCELREEGGGLYCYFTRKGVESEHVLDCCV
jgi:hypothetical protein